MPPLLANQIAAGEVIERPSSVVKELVENAIDAGATRITIELEQGGIELVRVSDDGAGIPEVELPLALAAHATSKVASVEDLERVGTMGFRGEALASILAVSRSSIRSRTAEQPGAAEVAGEADRIGPARPASGPVGTVVTVRNLFFNTPARRKFLRTPQTEQGRCTDVVRELAMAHSGIAFSVQCDGREVLQCPLGQSPRERCEQVLGRELGGELLEASADLADTSGGLSLWGLVGKPSLARATGAAMHLYVNGRIVRDRIMQHAVREAYRGLIEPGRWPTAVLMVEMDPTRVDVNVHPSKAEVRFRDSSMVHQAVLRAVRQALQSADLTGRIGQAGPGSTATAVGALRALYGDRGILPGGGPLPPAPPPGQSPRGPDAGARVIGAGAFAEYFKRFVPGQTGQRLSYEAIRAAVTQEPQDRGTGVPPVREAQASPEQQPSSLDPTTSNASASTDALSSPQSPTGGTPIPPIPGFHSSIPPGSMEQTGEELLDASPVNGALQVHNSFLVTQDAQGVVIVDQHALHERVMFEKLLSRIGSGDLQSQRLLMPTVLKVDAHQLEALDVLRPLLKRIGTEVEPMGPDSVAVQAFATFLFDRNVEPGQFIAELLERAAADGFGADPEEAMREVLDMMACKAAVKAGDRLSDVELAELLALRDTVERSSNCPHGRPTSIRLTIRELEKLFGRT